MMLLSQESPTSNVKKVGRQSLLSRNVEMTTGKVIHSKSEQHVNTYDFHRLQHFSCDSAVRYMMYSESAAAFISLHSNNTLHVYKADGHKLTPSLHPAHFPFMGLTASTVSSCVVGWGPGPILTLLDKELHPLGSAHDALDICVCQAVEHSTEIVTAGEGNVCVWSVMLVRCKVKVVEGLQRNTFTQMVLAPPRPDRPHKAFVVCRRVVTVVDLDAGKVLERKKSLCSRNITAIVYCSHLDYLIIASQELSIKVWSPNWDLHATLDGHNGPVNSLFYCSALKMLLSSSADCTLRCWHLEEGDVVECVRTEHKTPQLCVGGTGTGDTFFSFSREGVQFWSISRLYNLHCKLGSDAVPLRQILVSPFPAPYPARVLCVRGDGDITLLAAETGAVITSSKVKQRILCVDYCLHREIMLALTEAGTVLQANMLTNPITWMQEWQGRGQGPWRQEDHVTGNDAQNLSTPGPAGCLILYSYIPETQQAFEGWKSLQERRGCSHRNKAALDDAKNKFLIIIGQSGGCVSVLGLDNGKILYRTPAHNGQRVTTMQVYPESGNLISAGEDLTVVVWTVNPYVQECLTQQQSLQCGQLQPYLAAQGPHLALTIEEPNSGTFSLMHFNLLTQSPANHPPMDGHSDCFTGLCVCPDLEAFVSSSLDGTVCIWNKENHLIRTFQLNAVPECMAYCGLGDIFLGIRGDVYRMSCAEFLPHIYQQMLLYTFDSERLPDSPINKNKETYGDRKTANRAKEEEKSESITRNIFSTEDRLKESLVTSDTDLAALLLGTVKCKKDKPVSTKETKKEAFDRYMNIIYGLPPNIKFELEDTFDPNKLSLYPEPRGNKPCSLPPTEKDVCHKRNLSVSLKKKKCKLQVKMAPASTSAPRTLREVEPQPVLLADEVTHQKPVILEKDDTEVQENTTPKEEPKPKTPAAPAQQLQTLTPLPSPWETTPEVPRFLRQFSEEDWFKDLCPDKCVKTTPENFSWRLLEYLKTCSAPTRIKILTALRTLHSQGLTQKPDELHRGLLDLLPKFVRPHMSSVEQTMIYELLHLSVRLKSDSYDLVIKLLALLAYKELGLREAVLCVLTALGVHEADPWLWTELESWHSELRPQSCIWKNLHARSNCWLDVWTSKYKRHNRYLGTPAFTAVEVLNYFCRVQRDKYKKAQSVAPVGQKNTVLLPVDDHSSQSVLRLGETHTMARVHRPPAIILPPLRNRPFLMHVPNLISFPLSRITLSPFHVCSDQNFLKAWPRRYFIQQQSYVEYYR